MLIASHLTCIVKHFVKQMQDNSLPLGRSRASGHSLLFLERPPRCRQRFHLPCKLGLLGLQSDEPLYISTHRAERFIQFRDSEVEVSKW